MTDQAIIDAAIKAGLCFPLCWDLQYDEENFVDDTHWIKDGFEESSVIGEERQRILDYSNYRRQDRMNQLRHFVQLIMESNGLP